MIPCDFGDFCDMVEDHKYWTREEDNRPGSSIPPFRPPTPPHPASNDHVDSDDEEEELIVNGIFGPLKVDPIEKAEFEKTVDEALEIIKGADIKFQRQNNIAASIDVDWNQTS